MPNSSRKAVVKAAWLPKPHECAIAAIGDRAQLALASLA
jgi:hypothetical protein